METQYTLAHEPLHRLIPKYAVPCVISLLVNSLYNIVDQIFIGQGVGYLGNGATNIVFPLTVIALAFSLLIGDGGAAFLSLRLGEQNPEKARQGVGNSVLMVTVFSLFLTAFFLLFMQPLLLLFGATDRLMPFALDYGYIIVAGLPFVMIGTALNSMIRADGSPKFAMFSMLTGAVFNTVLDPVLIFILHMGVRGAAIATVVGQIASFLLCVCYLFHFKTGTLGKDAFRFHHSVCRMVLKLGISSFITQLSITIVMAVMNNLLKTYGARSVYGAEIPLTAIGIAMKVNQILISILVGIASGTQPIIGFNYGARNYLRTKKAFFTATWAAELIAAIAFILFQFFPMAIVSIFGSEDALYNAFAVKCFRIFLLFCILNGFQTVSSIYLQAIGSFAKSALLSLSRQIVFLVPASIILPLFFGVEGVLYAGPFADGLAFLLTFFLIRQNMRELHALEKLQQTAHPGKTATI